MRRLVPFLVLAVLAAGLIAAPRQLTSRAALSPDFVHFESGHVHPMAMTPDGSRLLVVNTPDGRLTVFDLTGQAPVRAAEIPVGLEPVSVAALDDQTAWVVNQLSDDVSVVDLTTLHVRATLRVGDEPSDVVFAGAPLRAYVSVSEEDAIKVYDPSTLVRTATVPIAAAYPRALARNQDGSRVFVTMLHAGNRTSVLSQLEAQDSLPPPNPPMSAQLPPAPDVGLIIQQQNGDWRDESGKLWNAKVKYTVRDVDLAVIETGGHTVVREVGDIGTVNFALGVSPANGDAWLTGTEARNLVRFEPNLRGHNVDTRIACVPAAAAPAVALLNPHVNYAVTPGPPSEADSAIGIPTGLCISGDGHRVYVTSLTSNRLGVLDANAAVLARIPTVAGPTGVLVDDARGRVYVLGRFRGELQTLSLADFATVAIAGIGFDPTPDEIVNGRRFFYGGFTSGHGEHACASCHVFGDFDNIAWDLGDPTGAMQPIDRTGQIDPFIDAQVHPMKGPMATQSLRGLPNTGMLHWRADREDLAAFNPAFVGLLGRQTALPDSEMAAFTDFVMPLAYPPNPNQRLDRTMPDAPPGQPSAARGQTFFFNTPVDGGQPCNVCHTATNFGSGTNGQIINNIALQESQDMKVPQLRNMYRKTGFADLAGAVNKRGFGFIHDGSIDNLFNFLQFPGFNFAGGAQGDGDRRDVEAFMLAFDTGLAPAVGAQVTFNGVNNGDAAAIARLDTLVGQADLGYCDLIAKGRVSGQSRGWHYTGGGQWQPDKAAGMPVTTLALRTSAVAGGEVTFTGVPPGSGPRMGIDRDRDTFPDGDELDAGSDPGNPLSTPGNVAVAGTGSSGFAMLAPSPNPFAGATEIAFRLGARSRVDAVVYDILGREVQTLARGVVLEPGRQSLRWDGRSRDGSVAGPGVYFVKVQAAQKSWSRPLVKLR